MPARSASFFGSQTGVDTERPLHYTGSPWQLLLSDIRLFFQNIVYLPCLFLPWVPWPSGELDELYPSLPNIQAIVLHSILFVIQLGFLISLPFLAHLPFFLFASYVGGTLALNTAVCRLLNDGVPDDGLKSTEDEYSRSWAPRDDEYWIFLNGICVGRHWLQNNIDRLSRTFHRPVVGVHNKTSGVVFDLVQILIQRSLFFGTSDIRECYVLVKRALYRPGIKKVVLILHSQGGIEGGMIVDWLLNEVPQDLLQYLEVYTFACIANHFNNPYRTALSSAAATTYSESLAAAPEQVQNRAISHVEHYANNRDFGSRFGVLNFIRKRPESRLENRFMGRVFLNPRSGHQLNQHYLDSIFPLDPTGRFVREPVKGDFMDMDVSIGQIEGGRTDKEGPVLSLYATGLLGKFMDSCANDSVETVTEAEMLNISPVSRVGRGIPNHDKTNGTYGTGNVEKLKMRDLSRLWLYRNGGNPPP